MKTGSIPVASLLLVFAAKAFAVGPNTTSFEYKCVMPCGELSEAGLGNCRGAQLAGVATKDPSGTWTIEETDFVYSPHAYEYFHAVSCPAHAKAKISSLTGGDLYITADAGMYNPPAQCPDGSSITGQFHDETRKFSLFLKDKGWDSKLGRVRYTSLATVESTTMWGSPDFSPDCQITNEKN